MPGLSPPKAAGVDGDGTGLLQQVGIEAKPEEDEGDVAVKSNIHYVQIWLISPRSWHCPRRARAPWPGSGAPEGQGRAGLSSTFLALKGGGEEVLTAPPDTKDVVRIL